MNITILASGRSSQCKRFFKDGDVVRSKKAEMSSYFRYESREVDGIEEFAGTVKNYLNPSMVVTQQPIQRDPN